MSILDTLRADIEGVFERHASELETVTTDAAKVVTNPAVETIAGLEHVPQSWLQDIANSLLDVDHALARMKANAAAATESAPVPDPTEPSGTLDGSTSAQTAPATPMAAPITDAQESAPSGSAPVSDGGPAPKIGDVANPA